MFAKKKIERANYHIADLERQTAIFIAEKPQSFGIKRDPRTGEQFLTIHFLEEPPDILAHIIADAIHNLRCALDHVAWEVAAIGHGAQNSKTTFPTGDRRSDFVGRCNGIETPSQWVKDTFLSLEAFPDELGHDLFNLCKLNNTDKHRTINPIFGVTNYPPVTIIERDGSTKEEMVGSIVPAAGVRGEAILMRFPADVTIELGDDTQSTPSIFFPKPNRVAEPAWSMLRTFRTAVWNAIETFEAAVPK